MDVFQTDLVYVAAAAVLGFSFSLSSKCFRGFSCLQQCLIDFPSRVFIANDAAQGWIFGTLGDLFATVSISLSQTQGMRDRGHVQGALTPRWRVLYIV